MNSTPESIYTVSQLNAQARAVIEDCFQGVWVTGEISNLARPSSGHMYFSLKDKNAQVRCALFRNSGRRLNFNPENGQQVLVYAQVSIYEARGDFQLIALQMEPAGAGALQIEFENLKKRLAKEGLFEETYKQPIPSFPKKIGVITSPSGAAIRDIVKVLGRRFASIPVIIYPSAVQGDKAASELVSAIASANQREECDVLIVARGGGSLEDLWPFNEEIVARAIFSSNIPIVSGVGHEVDFTIADFVADQRAATPSAAAELISPDKAEWLQKITQLQRNLLNNFSNQMQGLKIQLSHLQKRLKDPKQRLHDQAQHLDRLEQHLILSFKNYLSNKQSQLNLARSQINSNNPIQQLKKFTSELNSIHSRITININNNLQQKKQRLSNLSRALDAISPLQTLQRGYAIVHDSKTNSIIRSVKAAKVGDRMTATLLDGKLDCLVERISKQ